MYGKVDKGEEDITDWKVVNEKYFLFPFKEALTNHREDSMMLSNVTEQIREYFPENITVLGKGFYINEEFLISIKENRSARVYRKN